MRNLVLVLGLLFGLTFAATAQSSDPAIDYERWETTATRAEQVLTEAEASSLALETLRADIADWRARLLAAAEANQSRIATIQSQIDALGSAPLDGETEPQEIAARRAELNDQLATLRAPVLKAEEAYNRASGLISEIDAIIRDRQADRLLTLGPSPLNPANWPAAFEAALDVPAALMRELRQSWASPGQRNVFTSQLPLILVLIATGIILIWKGRTWSERTGAFLRDRTRRGTGVWSFLVSVGIIVLPWLGILALVSAIKTTEMPGMRGTILIEEVPLWGAYLLGLRWLCIQVFAAPYREQLLPLEEADQIRGYRYGMMLGLALVARSMIGTLTGLSSIETNALVVLEFPLIVLIGVFLFRMGQILSHPRMPEASDEEEARLDVTFRLNTIRLLGRAGMALAVVGPVLAAIGYFEAAIALIYPPILTLALLAFLMVLRRFLTDIYRLITKTEDVESDGLIPVLIGMALTIGAIPFFAVIWGARETQLYEIWTRFNEGVSIGETRFSPTDFLTFVIIFAIGMMLTRLAQGAMRSTILPKTKIDAGGQNAIVSGMGYVGILLAALIAISSAGLDLSSLAIVAGALSVGIGFGLQNIVSNFVSGIILLIERPISEGDWIEVGGQHGYVRDISVRSTRIETFDRTDVIVPNADLVSGTVTNYTRGNTVGRVIVPVGVAYGTDTRRVEGILREIAEGHPMILATPAPSVVFQRFGADSLDFEIRGILRDVNWVMAVKSDLNHEIAKRFAEEGIEIPFAQRDIWLRNPEALTGGKAADDATPPPKAPMSTMLLEPDDINGEDGDE